MSKFTKKFTAIWTMFRMTKHFYVNFDISEWLYLRLITPNLGILWISVLFSDYVDQLLLSP